MKNFCNLKYVERYEDAVDLEKAPITNVADNAHHRKDGYRFVVDNSGELTPLDCYNSRISVDFKVNKLADSANIAATDHNGIVNGSHSFIKKLDIELSG